MSTVDMPVATIGPMDIPSWLTILTALGAGSLIQWLVQRWLSSGERRIGLDVSLVGAAGELLQAGLGQQEALSLRLDAAVSRMDALEAENDALREKLSALETENERLREKLAATEEYAEEIRSLSNRNDRLRRRVKSLEDYLRAQGLPVHDNGGEEQ